MTNEEVLFVANNLTAVDAPDMEPGFNYSVSGNLTEAERVAKKIRDAIKPSDEMKEYEKKMQELREKHSDKDEKGNPKFTIIILPNGQSSKQYTIPAAESPNSPFGKDIKKLKDEYQKHIDKYEKNSEFLQEENKDFKPEWIELEDVPKGLPRAAMDALYYVIKKPTKK